MRSERIRALALAVAAACAAPGAGAPLLESILAVVDGRPVLLSEVRVVEALRGVDRRAALEALIDERLMLREASRLSPTSLSAAEDERAYESLRALPAAAALLPGAEADLRRLARRQAAILRYVDFRFRPQVRVSDEAVRAAYQAEQADQPSGPAFEAAAPRLRARLEALALDEKIEAWVKELRAAAEVRYNPAPPGDA
jgi:hypothetical protein